jgi:hypothetical protein
MLKKSITYTDYDGNERTEDFYFNLSEVELTKMEFATSGGLENSINKIVDSKDVDAMLKMIEKLILASYGEKSEDGRRFNKSSEISEGFMQTEAYNKLFMELIRDENSARNFVRGILPANIARRVEEQETLSKKEELNKIV